MRAIDARSPGSADPHGNRDTRLPAETSGEPPTEANTAGASGQKVQADRDQLRSAQASGVIVCMLSA
jgi:hypothetical protein